MFSQDFFLAIVLQDSSPGEGQHGPGHDVGRGWQGAQKWWRPQLGCRAGVAWLWRGRRGRVTGAWCVCMCMKCLPAFVCGKG